MTTIFFVNMLIFYYHTNTLMKFYHVCFNICICFTVNLPILWNNLKHAKDLLFGNKQTTQIIDLFTRKGNYPFLFMVT